MEEMMLTVMACSKLYYYLALQHRYEKTSYLLQVHYFMWPISFAADPSDRAVWGVGMQPLACSKIVGSNSTGGHGCLSVCCECCVLSGSLCDELITRPGVLPTAVCRCLRSRNLGNEEALAHLGGLFRQTQNKNKKKSLLPLPTALPNTWVGVYGLLFSVLKLTRGVY